MDAIERFKKMGQSIIKGFASVSKSFPQSAPTQQNTNKPIDINVLMRNLIDQTSYSSMGMDVLNETPIQTKYMPNNNIGGFYGRGAITLNTANTDPNQTLGILRHELGHASDVNAQGYRFTPSSVSSDALLSTEYPNSYGLMNNIRKVNPQAALRLEGRLSDWGQFYNEPQSSENQYFGTGNWRDTEAYATMAETPNKIMTPSLQQRFRQYIPMSKNINYSPVYPSPELLQTIQR